MLIAITASEGSMGASVEERFGRARGFVLYETVKKDIRWVDNSQNLQSPQGAGIQSAKHVIDSGTETLIARNVGPKAHDLLERSGVSIFHCPEECGTVADAVELFSRGTLRRIPGANREGHW